MRQFKLACGVWLILSGSISTSLSKIDRSDKLVELIWYPNNHQYQYQLSVACHLIKCITFNRQSWFTIIVFPYSTRKQEKWYCWAPVERIITVTPAQIHLFIMYCATSLSIIGNQLNQPLWWLTAGRVCLNKEAWIMNSSHALLFCSCTPLHCFIIIGNIIKDKRLRIWRFSMIPY